MSRDDNGKNLNFVQIDRRVMASHRELMISSPVAAVILSALTEYMDKGNAIVISYSTLQEITGYSRASVGKAISKLKKDNWIQAIKIGTANVYLVNSAAFWTASNKGKYFSKFHATVIASANEQSLEIDKLKAVKLKGMPIVHRNERAIVGTEELPPPDQSDLELN